MSDLAITITVLVLCALWAVYLFIKHVLIPIHIEVMKQICDEMERELAEDPKKGEFDVY